MSVYPLQEYLPADHELAVKLRDLKFPGREILTIPRLGTGTRGQCYENVRAMVRMRGGRPRLGWLLTWWPNHYVEALHHAVWERSDGELQDISQSAYPTVIGDWSTFIAEPEAELGELDPTVPSHFLNLDGERGTRDLARQTRDVVLAKKAFVSYIVGNDIPFEVEAGQFKVPKSLEVRRLFDKVQAADKCKLYRTQQLLKGKFSTLK